ncbi:methane monooxygenase/ammonia monooxygenase subunit C [Methylohalobius crimeensis]|uniref:methane monooxygenase/ammonia monooxygenase subunit C n=1 Tax=Methylohalobius crimeensis TaxID=244365 RepID=UPI0003B2E45C|nr:methane monooxygenase/ammonia monooxygenase subunit C [Methylohalobius crimeensis]
MTTRPQTEVKVTQVEEKPLLQVKNLVSALIGFTLFYLAVRWYQEAYGWTKGLDAYSPEFKLYWMSLMYVELALEAVAAAALWGWLWKTRDRRLEDYWMHLLKREIALERVKGAELKALLNKKRDRGLAMLTPREELRRNMTHLIWLAVYAWTFYWGVSFFTEQDATWHQTVIRDTDFTPSHIVVFYLSYPIFIITGGGAFLYAKTRVPYFAKGLSIPYLMLVVGPFTILPNVGFNEWGHTFWFMEEIFVAPLHWGFVVFCWFALSVMGVMLQVFSSILYLIENDLLSENPEALLVETGKPKEPSFPSIY